MTSKHSKFGIAVASLSLAAGMALTACGGTDNTPTVTTSPTSATGTSDVGMTPSAMMGTTPSAMMTGASPSAMMGTDATASAGMMGTTPSAMMGTTPSAMMGTTPGSSTSGGTFSGDTIKIGIDLPLSGGDASVGLPTLNGMQLAIDQANAAGGVTIGGKTYKLQSNVLDDVPPGQGSHDPAQGAKNADSFIGDPSTLIMLGPFNSSVAQAMMPKLNNAGVCSISPSNTNETLTKPQFNKTKDYRPTGNVTYFRVCTTDDIQGPAAADYAYDTLKLRKVYILDDTEAYGKGLGDNFEREFKAKGGQVLGHEGVPKNTTDFSSIMTKVAGFSPDLLYYGGTSSNNIPVARKQMKAAGLNIPLMGGDGISDKQYLDVAGADGVGSYMTLAAVNVNTLPEATQFIKDYNAHNFKEALGSYSGPGYDAAGIAIDAIKHATTLDRAGVCQALRQTKGYKGALGDTSFDENGDTSNKVISFYKDEANGNGSPTNGQQSWVFADQIRFTGK